MFLDVDDSYLMFQYKDAEEIEMVLDNEFGNFCNGFIHKKIRYSFRWR